MIKNSRIIKRISIIFILCICLLYVLGYRINSLDAARANSFIDDDMILIDQLHVNWADIYFFYDEKEDIYRTAISEKKVFLYDSRASVWLYNHKEDPIKTIGSISYSNGKGKSITARLIELIDPNVDYIEGKLGNEITRTKITTEKPIILSLKNYNNISQLEVIAYNSEGKGLYYYGYPKGTNHFKNEDYKWHVIEDYAKYVK